MSPAGMSMVALPQGHLGFCHAEGLCTMSQVVVIPNQSRCVKIILSQRTFSEGGCEVVWCSMPS